ncbi:hypothetical protein [Yersinia intermedia]|uniref:hypothetical protein n=1 Tax=Yersinia intermedia TaxID=631 RepID=UPI0005E43199|nr:hypothetical protein [Yersinia intermedia]MCB5298288.1 hypothetical protein [Yersinia intermedia]CNJ31740.1 Uncharacterised protein [Yersinia intermedia]
MNTNPIPALQEIKVLSSGWVPGEGRIGEKEVNKLLQSNKWIMLSTSSGVDSDGFPVHQWVMGKLVQ